MADDIVTRLRHGDAGREEAIAEIERLREVCEDLKHRDSVSCDLADELEADNVRLRAALERIAAIKVVTNSGENAKTIWRVRAEAGAALADRPLDRLHRMDQEMGLGTNVPSEGKPIEPGYPDSDGLPGATAPASVAPSAPTRVWKGPVEWGDLAAVCETCGERYGRHVLATGACPTDQPAGGPDGT